MRLFVRAVVTGFGLSLGSALFKKVQDRIGLGEDKDEAKAKAKKPGESDAIRQDGGTDPQLQS